MTTLAKLYFFFEFLTLINDVIECKKLFLYFVITIYVISLIIFQSGDNYKIEISVGHFLIRLKINN